MSPVGVWKMNFDMNSIFQLSDDDILKKMSPIINDVFNCYFFLTISNEQKKEIVKKIISKSRDNYDGKELYADYLKKNMSLYLDDYIKFLFSKRCKLNATILNKYLESLPNVSNVEEAIDVINKLTVFASKYDYIIDGFTIYKLLGYSEKFATIANYCINNQKNIDTDNYLVKLIIEIYYEKLNNDIYNDNYRECQTSFNAYIKEVTNIPLLSIEDERKSNLK